MATPYRCQVGRVSIDVFENNVSGDRILEWCGRLEFFRTNLLEIFVGPQMTYSAVSPRAA